MHADSLVAASLVGPKLHEFLQGYITSDLDSLRPGEAQPMAIPDIKGRVVANGWVVDQGDETILLLPSSTVPIVRQHLLPYMRFARVELVDASHPWYLTRELDKARFKTILNEPRLWVHRTCGWCL